MLVLLYQRQSFLNRILLCPFPPRINLRPGATDLVVLAISRRRV